jgi:PIN domain nuclease of toxin-antitoxin system
LPGELHGDPGDRLIVATARHLGAPIITRDQKILGYAQTGFVDAMPC